MPQFITRREINSLSVVELNNLREAFHRLQVNSRTDGYQALAAIHAQTGQHRNPLFLPWHREYIFRLEQALRASLPEAPDLHLPFWDWVSTSKIPDAFTAPQYRVAADTPLINNPLFSARRNKSDISGLIHRARSLIRALCESASFDQFWKRIHQPHDDLHSWIANDFALMERTAFDPLFWTFHASFDRYWSDWQRRRPELNPAPEVLVQDLPGFGKKARDVMDHVNALGYDYDFGGIPTCSQVVPVHGVRINRPNTPAPLGGRQKVILRVLGMQESAGSFLVKIFINQPQANHTTNWRDNPHYAGAFGIFGMVENHSHHMGHDHHANTLAEERERVLDITEIVARVVREREPVEVKLVAETTFGVPVDISQVLINGFRLETRD
jgi:tyrosinase